VPSGGACAISKEGSVRPSITSSPAHLNLHALLRPGEQKPGVIFISSLPTLPRTQPRLFCQVTRSREEDFKYRHAIGPSSFCPHLPRSPRVRAPVRFTRAKGVWGALTPRRSVRFFIRLLSPLPLPPPLLPLFPFITSEVARHCRPVQPTLEIIGEGARIPSALGRTRLAPTIPGIL
jgi:hypothetical protein